MSNFYNATFSFDPWGRMRNAADWDDYTISSQTMEAFKILGRGFTGHEHLLDYDLINMNGRCYDPILGQFIQPDNYVQMPEYAGGYNRFAYANNNPLIYVDPDGEIAWFVPIIIGAIMGGSFGAAEAYNSGGLWYQGLFKGAFVGAVGGALSWCGGTTIVGNLLWGATEGAITGGLNAALWKQDLGMGMLYGAAMGAGVAGLSIGLECTENAVAGEGFRTNRGVVENYLGNNDPISAAKFLDGKYGVTFVNGGGYEYSPTGPYIRDAAYTSLDGTIHFASGDLLNYDTFADSWIHEHAHEAFDIIDDGLGGRMWRYGSDVLDDGIVVSNPYSSDILSGLKNTENIIQDGPNGFYNSIENNGILKISNSRLDRWNDLYWALKSKNMYNAWDKFWDTFPRRWNQDVIISPFNK